METLTVAVIGAGPAGLAAAAPLEVRGPFQPLHPDLLQEQSLPHAIAENANWWDIRVATGTLPGGVVISSQYPSAVLIIAVLIMVSLLMAHLGAAAETF